MDLHEIHEVIESEESYQASFLKLGSTLLFISQADSIEDMNNFKVTIMDCEKTGEYVDYFYLSLRYNRKIEKVENDSATDSNYENAYIGLQKLSPFRSKNFRFQLDECLKLLNENFWNYSSGNAAFIYNYNSKPSKKKKSSSIQNTQSKVF